MVIGFLRFLIFCSYTELQVKNFMQRFHQKFLIFQEETAFANCYSSDCYFEAIDNKNSVLFGNDCHKPNDKMPNLTFS